MAMDMPKSYAAMSGGTGHCPRVSWLQSPCEHWAMLESLATLYVENSGHRRL